MRQKVKVWAISFCVMSNERPCCFMIDGYSDDPEKYQAIRRELKNILDIGGGPGDNSADQMWPDDEIIAMQSTALQKEEANGAPARFLPRRSME